MANISEFKSQMLGGGARANQFRVELSFPSYVANQIVVGQRAMFLCKAAQLPASTIENIAVQYRGRPINFAGERTFSPWTITVYNDTDFAIRNALEQWSNGIQNYNATTGIVTPTQYQADLSVTQLDRNGAPIKQYQFVDAYPVEVGAIELDYEAGNAIETFTCTFQYNFFTTNTATAELQVEISIPTPIGNIPL